MMVVVNQVNGFFIPPAVLKNIYSEKVEKTEKIDFKATVLKVVLHKLRHKAELNLGTLKRRLCNRLIRLQ